MKYQVERKYEFGDPIIDVTLELDVSLFDFYVLNDAIRNFYGLSLNDYDLKIFNEYQLDEILFNKKQVVFSFYDFIEEQHIDELALKLSSITKKFDPKPWEQSPVPF